MDKFKEKTIKDYTAWDIDCKYNTKTYDRRHQRIKNIFKRKARRNLKRELNREVKENN